MHFEKHSQNGLFINAIFPYIPPYIHGNRPRICKVERCFREKAGVFSFTLSHQIKRTNKSHGIHQTSSLRGAKFCCRKTSPKSKQQRLSSSCRLRERSIIWNGTRTPIQSKKKMGASQAVSVQTDLSHPPLPLFFSSGICLASHPCLLCWLTQCLALLNPLRSGESSGVQEGTAVGKRGQ